jgi:hypothetical protein
MPSAGQLAANMDRIKKQYQLQSDRARSAKLFHEIRHAPILGSLPILLLAVFCHFLTALLLRPN